MTNLKNRPPREKITPLNKRGLLNAERHKIFNAKIMTDQNISKLEPTKKIEVSEPTPELYKQEQITVRPEDEEPYEITVITCRITGQYWMYRT